MFDVFAVPTNCSVAAVSCINLAFTATDPHETLKAYVACTCNR